MVSQYAMNHRYMAQFHYLHIAYGEIRYHELNLTRDLQCEFLSLFVDGVPWPVEHSGKHGSHNFGWASNSNAYPQFFLARWHYAGDANLVGLRTVEFALVPYMSNMLGRANLARAST